jgi:hypothetical protein
MKHAAWGIPNKHFDQAAAHDDALITEYNKKIREESDVVMQPAGGKVHSGSLQHIVHDS